ncbi:unnamed protein product [Caenorhabditis auriculariae]|uniref:SAM domain-containing protein n=1 Tax=Caenorhabditis auriculariae TaxID=2777116 RepID=A0A8S1H8J3_9PELO|nr:unnamed protein product [Caenorhabditis auriculariae]
MLTAAFFLCAIGLVSAVDPVDTVANQGAEIFSASHLTGQTVRRCSCAEQRVCVEEMKAQAKDCTVPCFKKFDKITDRPHELKKCFDEKENILENFLTCFENRVEGCVEHDHGDQIAKTDIAAIFKFSEKKIVSQTATLQSIVAPIKHILDATGEFALCVKDCFLAKNKKGFCFDRNGCQPLVAEAKAKTSFRQCTRKLHWKREAGELCECSVHAGVEELKQYCTMFKLMGQRAPLWCEVRPVGQKTEDVRGVRRLLLDDDKEELTLLPDGRFEHKLQVDRRRLETMIIGHPPPGASFALPSADEFFTQVMSFSSAEVYWPSQLKIGAKTKKDPYVKLVGSVAQIERARSLICASLQVKKERLTLKLELHHSLHSHIIGKGGLAIQHVMRLTACHIHFPDSNKYSDSAKSDQVSISGTSTQVPIARRHIRAVSPISLSFETQSLHPTVPLEPLKPLPQANVSIHPLVGGRFSVALRMNAGEDAAILYTLRAILDHLQSPDFMLQVCVAIPAREETLSQLENGANHTTLLEMCQHFGVTVHVLHESQQVQLCGPAPGVLQIRRFIIGLFPIVVSFDVVASEVQHSASRVEKDFNVSITTKRKNHASNLLAISMKSTENRLADILRARETLMALPPSEYPSDEYTGLENGFRPEMSSMPDLTKPLFASLFEPSTPQAHLPSPKSPDPENSPLAASILKGAKEISRNSELWKKPRGDRGEMLMKATQAIFDENPSCKSSPRYPTDLWSGYGFSCSLPADLLKGMIDLSTGDEPSDGRLLVGRDAKTPPLPRGLCALREEDELSDFSGSFSSTSFQSAPHAYEKKPRTSFSASTSVFDSSPLGIGTENNWDIRFFTDPSMVLAQLACSEYMTQLREQEIDMHAFLLLDEQNLKDIGVSTIGARKKIHHAILKLRESARHHGYVL